MELVSGGDLLSPIERNGPYSERRAQHVFAQIVHAVRHLHASGTGPRPKPKPQPKPQQGPRPSAQLWPTPRACARACACICAQVRHLHSLGIVHRDLKPENICFTTAELQWVKLIDLGAAVRTSVYRHGI